MRGREGAIAIRGNVVSLSNIVVSRSFARPKALLEQVVTPREWGRLTYYTNPYMTIKMKSYLGYIAALCLLTPFSGVAQRSNVRAADRLLQSDKPNYTEIRRLIKLAEEHEDTKDDAYTYYVKGLVEHTLYKTEFRKVTTPGSVGDTAKMFRHVIDELVGWRRADSIERQPDPSTGRIVLKYQKKIQDYVREDAPKMYEAGLFWLDRKKYAESTAAFSAALEAQRLLLPVGRKELPTDTTVANLAYYALVSAYTGELYPEVIRLGELYRDVAANKNEVYQFLAKSHMAMQDTVGAMPFLEEGIRLYPETTFYFGSMISIYQAQGRYKEAVALIDKALKVTPDNPNLLVLRGNVYFLAQEWDRAVEVYRQVLRLSPDNYDALFNLGQVYYNQAVSILANPLSSRLEEKKAKEYFRQSLPQLEAAYKIAPDQVRDLLGNVYYRLGLEQKYAELYTDKPSSK